MVSRFVAPVIVLLPFVKPDIPMQQIATVIDYLGRTFDVEFNYGHPIRCATQRIGTF